MCGVPVYNNNMGSHNLFKISGYRSRERNSLYLCRRNGVANIKVATNRDAVVPSQSI